MVAHHTKTSKICGASLAIPNTRSPYGTHWPDGKSPAYPIVAQVPGSSTNVMASSGQTETHRPHSWH